MRVKSVSGDFHLSPLCGGIKGQISAGLMGPSCKKDGKNPNKTHKKKKKMHEKIREKIQEKNSFVIFLIKNWVFKLFLVIFFSDFRNIT